MKKNVSSTLLMFALLSNVTNARVIQRDTSASTGSGNRGISPQSQPHRQGSTDYQRGAVNCGFSNYVEVGLLRGITDPNDSEENAVQIYATSATSGEMYVNNYISECIKLEPQKVSVDGNVFVRTENKYEYSASEITLPGETKTPDELDSMSMSEKHYRCLKNKGFIKGEDGTIDYQKALSMGKVTNFKFPFNYDKGDGQKSVNVYYATPSVSEYKPVNEIEGGKIRALPQEWSCFKFDNVNAGITPPRMYVSEYDFNYDKAIKACQNSDPMAIYNELVRLRESNVGNYNELAGILKAAFDEASKSKADEIYKSLKDIEAVFERRADGKIPSESLATSKAREYAEKVKELESIILDPMIDDLRRLEKLKTSENEEEINKEIAKIHENIAKFNKEHRDGFDNKIKPVLTEYGIKVPADKVNYALLKSELYAEASKPDGRFDLRDADDTLKRRDGEFKAKTQHWVDMLASKRGDKRPVQEAIDDLEGIQDNMNSEAKRYEKYVRSQEKSACKRSWTGGYANPNKCQRWQKRKSRLHSRFLKRRKKYLVNYRSRFNEYRTYEQNYSDYRQDHDDDNFSFGDWDFGRDDGDDFDFSFNSHGSWGQQNDWRYSMGGAPGYMGSPQFGGYQTPMIYGPGQGMQAMPYYR